MNDFDIRDIPTIHAKIECESKKIGFTMPSDLHIGTLLKTLISSKVSGRFLEIGTGIGLSLSWMIDGMDKGSKLITLDNDPELTAIAQEYFGNDRRVEIVCQDGAEWIANYRGGKFDLIFADAWPGKYVQIDETLNLIKPGGFYVIDDMSVQPNWPSGHEDNVESLISYLEEKEDYNLTKMNWSTGLIIAVRIK